MKSNISIIDDDKNLSELLSKYLTNQGYSVTSSKDGLEGLNRFTKEQPDIVILDVSMPKKDGWKTLEKIREISSTPVVMLTARSDEQDILHGFSLGADDYITKPFSFAELTARVQAVLSRAVAGKGKETRNIKIGDLNIDFDSSKVYVNKQLVSLTPTEFKLLRVLVSNLDATMSPDDLVRQVWGDQYAGEVGHVRRYIWHLRQKIEPNPKDPTYIENVHGFGYRFSSTVIE